MTSIIILKYGLNHLMSPTSAMHRGSAAFIKENNSSIILSKAVNRHVGPDWWVSTYNFAISLGSTSFLEIKWRASAMPKPRFSANYMIIDHADEFIDVSPIILAAPRFDMMLLASLSSVWHYFRSAKAAASLPPAAEMAAEINQGIIMIMMQYQPSTSSQYYISIRKWDMKASRTRNAAPKRRLASLAHWLHVENDGKSFMAGRQWCLLMHQLQVPVTIVVSYYLQLRLWIAREEVAYRNMFAALSSNWYLCSRLAVGLLSFQARSSVIAAHIK